MFSCVTVTGHLGSWNTSFRRASQIPQSLQIEGLQQPWVDQVSTIFPTVCLLCVYVSCLTVNIFNFYIVIFIMIVYDQ